MNNKSIEFYTVKDNLCIGCGICKTVCPVKAVKMEFCDEKYMCPAVDNEKCINCGLCVRFCPNTIEKIKEESRKVVTYTDYREFGISGSKYYTAYVKEEKDRLQSASGGIVTAFAQWLLVSDKIDIVVHAKTRLAKTGELHYEACISSTVAEIDKNRSSFYSAISFSEVLDTLKKYEHSTRVLVIGTPCVVRGIRDLFTNCESFKQIKKIYTCALCCSHNVNGMFIDYLSDSQKVDRNQAYGINLRAKLLKLDIDASNFNNRWFSDDNKTISIVNRFKSEFTKQWQNYSFSMNVCNACSDFWGYSADISVKDAWGGKWDKDPLGTSMIILRNKELKGFFENNKNLFVYEEDHETILRTQSGTIKFKQYYARKRVNINSAQKLNMISLQHILNYYMRKISISKYKEMRFTGYNDWLKRRVRIIGKIRIYAEGIDNKIIKIRGMFDK